MDARLHLAVWVQVTVSVCVQGIRGEQHLVALGFAGLWQDFHHFVQQVTSAVSMFCRDGYGLHAVAPEVHRIQLMRRSDKLVRGVGARGCPEMALC